MNYALHPILATVSNTPKKWIETSMQNVRLKSPERAQPSSSSRLSEESGNMVSFNRLYR